MCSWIVGKQNTSCEFLRAVAHSTRKEAHVWEETRVLQAPEPSPWRSAPSRRQPWRCHKCQVGFRICKEPGSAPIGPLECPALAHVFRDAPNWTCLQNTLLLHPQKYLLRWVAQKVAFRNVRTFVLSFYLQNTVPRTQRDLI